MSDDEKRRAWFAVVIEFDARSVLSSDVEMVLEVGMGDGRYGDVKVTAVAVSEQLHTRLVAAREAS